MGLISSRNCILMNVVFDFLDQLNLTALAIDGNRVGISRSEEVLEDLERITAETVCLLAAQLAWNAVLQHLFSISVICLSQFGSAEDFEGLADLAELKVDLCHALGVLIGVEGERQDAEFLCDLLERRLS